MKKLSDYPEFVTEQTKYTDLQHQLSEVDKQIQDLIHNINALAKQPRISKLDLEAKSLLSGDSIKADDLTQAEQNLSTLQHKQRVILHALEIQKREVERVRGKVSKEIVLAVKPQHDKAVAAVCKAAIAFGEALQAEASIRDSFDEMNVSYLSWITPMGFHAAGFIRNENSNISRYLLEAVERGFISKSDLPEHLRQFVKQKQKPVADDKPSDSKLGINWS